MAPLGSEPYGPHSIQLLLRHGPPEAQPEGAKKPLGLRRGAARNPPPPRPPRRPSCACLGPYWSEPGTDGAGALSSPLPPLLLFGVPTFKPPPFEGAAAQLGRPAWPDVQVHVLEQLLS
mmetsp:Transcript_17804/g.40796  ORF Transcript_17804/g.40796 Transcript_17804/m.40796 type:complete len:119 (-) Transcript_17804:2612-2968(-)